MDLHELLKHRALLATRREVFEAHEAAADISREYLSAAIHDAIIKTDIDLTDICELSGVSRSTLYRRFRPAIDIRNARQEADADPPVSGEIPGQLNIDGEGVVE